MKKIFHFILATIFLSICASQAFSQTDVASDNAVQKKHKVFVRADFAGYNLSFYPNASNTGGLYTGVHTAYTVGYCLPGNMRLGIGGEATTEAYLGNQGGRPRFTAIPVYASFEYGDHSKRIAPYFDVNAGYAFITSTQSSLTDGYKNFTDGPFVEFMPVISFGSRHTPNRFRMGLGSELQFTTLSYHDAPVFGTEQPVYYGKYNSQTGVFSYNTFITRLVFEVGFDF